MFFKKVLLVAKVATNFFEAGGKNPKTEVEVGDVKFLRTQKNKPWTKQHSAKT